MILLLCLAPGACTSQPTPTGRRGVSASYRWNTLSADLPVSARVPAVVAAAERALLEGGYSIDRSSMTAERGVVWAIPPHGDDQDDDGRVTVAVEQTASGARCGITVGRWGDRSRSRAILDGILTRLGM